MILVVDSTGNGNANSFLAAIDSALVARQSEHPSVAFDCEGVHLSRAGTVEIVALYFGKLAETDDVFLVDVGTKYGVSSALRAKLKELLESQTVVKIIHDVRMDSDALFHLHGITVNNIHVTASYHEVLTGRPDVSLKDMLKYYGIDESSPHDRSVYKHNPTFWAARPLTEQMKAWASGHVDKLLLVAEKQLDELNARGDGQALLEAALRCPLIVAILET